TLRSRRRWRPRERAWTARSVADLLLQVFPAFLLVDRALGGETRFQAIQADLLARIHAVAVLARVHALERAVDLADQLAVAVAGAQFQRVLGFAGGTLGFVADVAHFVLEVLDGLLGFLDQVRAPLQQALAEVLGHQRTHVLLFRARPVALGHDRTTVLVGLVRNDLDLGPRCGRGRRGDAGDRDLADRTRLARRTRNRRRFHGRLLGGARRGLGDRTLRRLLLRSRGRSGLFRDRDRRLLRDGLLHCRLGDGLRSSLLRCGLLRRNLLRHRLLHRRGLLRHRLLRRCDLLHGGLLRHGFLHRGLLRCRLPGGRS